MYIIIIFFFEFFEKRSLFTRLKICFYFAFGLDWIGLDPILFYFIYFLFSFPNAASDPGAKTS